MKTYYGKLAVVSPDFPSEVPFQPRCCCVCSSPSKSVVYNPSPYSGKSSSYLINEIEYSALSYPANVPDGTNYTFGDLFLCERQECLDIILLMNAEKI